MAKASTLELPNLSDHPTRSSLANADRATGGAVAGCVCGGTVCFGDVDETVLSVDELQHHLKVLGRVESSAAAIKARMLAELNRRQSKTTTQEFLRNELKLSNREAKRETETASQLAELPETSDALASGKITKRHADLIARASGESDVDEAFLAETASEQGFDEFTRTTKRHQQEVATDDGESIVERQRKNRKARIFESSDTGMFVLTGEFDQITGARIATALTAKERQLWHSEDPKARITPQQRMADALAELICESGDSNGDGKQTKSQGTDLLVIADFDVLSQQLNNPRLADGSPIPLVELHRLALEANLLPSIFDAKTQNMWLGRKQRTASHPQRVALIARDQRCVGCGTNPLWCRAHHVKYWSNNGPTDIDNLVLVCDRCHHKIHDDGWTVSQHPTNNKYMLKPPNPTTRARPGRLKQRPRKKTPEPNARNRKGELKQQQHNKPPNPAKQGRHDHGRPSGSVPTRSNATAEPP